MAINLKFDLLGNPEPPSIILSNRNGNKLGQLNVNAESIDVDDKFNGASEFSFTLNKYIDDEPTPLWDKVVDFKLVYCSEWDMWFEIKVELDETTETVKTVFCTQLGQAELSQIMVYNIEINTDVDIEREDYKTSILYDEKNPKSSILHRLLEKAPHYSIAYVDESIQRIQRQFSFDGVSICDAFNEIAEEIGCLFVYNSNSQAGGKPNRTISVYDLQQNCNNKDCKHRGEFTDKCPKCGSTDITYGYGDDTTIFVTADELATEGIQLVTDTDSVKNCFKLEAGDDLMTATIRNCNPNGSDYIWYFSDSMKEDMSKELVDRIEGYDELYKEYYNNHISQLNEALVNQYNELVEKYDDYYNTKSTCLDCKNEGYFEEQCNNPNCNSKNILAGQKLQTMPTTITGYPALMTAYYNTIDLLLYLESSLMPSVEMSDTTAEEQVQLLTTSSLSPVAVNVQNAQSISVATANSAVLSMAKVLIRPTYKVEILDDSASLSTSKTWTGKFVVTNYSDDTDTATSDVISVGINNDTETFLKQKIDKALNKENTDDYSISGLFNKDYNAFCEELKKYALNPLNNFSKACDTCLSILTEQSSQTSSSLYNDYFKRQQAINNEIKIRQDELTIIEGVWDMSDENNPKCTTKGLQQYIEDCQKEIQDALNFEKYLGEDLWLEFCSYRREDKYSNSNYISDGLNNVELFNKANEFIEVAEKEIFKSAELQHSISATLNNLLSLPKFKPLLQSFRTGNWIRVQVNDEIYKLRLLKYEFRYGNSENIAVEFSDVIKIKNGITDIQSVLSQASSMASSYDSVQRQAQKADVARGTIDQWLTDGLNSANVRIQSNDNEEIVLTQSGLLARSYDDITGTYSPEQFKLTHNIMAYTDDNWETVSSALGKHNYKYWEDGNFVDAEGYGLTSKFVSAGYITGSQIISGEIISDNYEINKSGTYFDLNKGDFEIAGGKIAYNATSDIVTLDGVTIVWDNGSTNAPTINQINGLSDALDKLGNLSNDAEQSAKDYADEQDEKLSDALTDAYQEYTDSEISEFDSYVAKYFGLGGNTIFGDNYLISPYIGGGYLNITNTNNNSRVIIDPNNLTGNEYIFQVHNGDKVTVGVNSSGNAEFSGTITASNIIGESTLQVGAQYDEDNNFTGYLTTIDSSGKLTCINADVTGDITADSLTLRKQIQLGNEEEGYHTWISPDGVLKTENANISGEIRAASGQIGGFTIEPTETEEGDAKAGGWLYSGESIGSDKSIFLSATDMQGNASFFDETIGNWRLTVGNKFGVTSDGTTYMSDCEITGGSLRMGNVNDGYSAWISVDEGVLNANGVNISGTINAVEGNIGSWNINATGILGNGIGLYSGGGMSYASAIMGGKPSSIRIYAGVTTQTKESKGTVTLYKDGTGSLHISMPIANLAKIDSVIIKSLSIIDEDSGVETEIENDESIQIIAYIEDKQTICIMVEKSSYSNTKIIVTLEYTVVNVGNAATKILDDGSLYANAVNISGRINATSGTFSGDIYAENGTIGGLLISSNGISSASNALLFDTDSSSIFTSNLQVSNKLQVSKVSGFAKNSPYLDFEGESTKYETVTVTAQEPVVENKGSYDMYKQITDEGKVSITLKADKILTSSKGLYITVYYQTTYGKQTYEKSYSYWVQSNVMLADTDTYTFSVPYLKRAFIEFDTGVIDGLGVYDIFEYSRFTYTPNSFSQISAESTHAVVCSSHFVPLKDAYLNLGATDNPWNYAYLNHESHSSDRKIKDNINDIEADFSKQLISGLSPKSYIFKTAKTPRIHYGFIAQEVEELLADLGTSADEVGLVCKSLPDEPDGENNYYSLNYINLIAPMTSVIQQLLKRVEELEHKTNY